MLLRCESDLTWTIIPVSHVLMGLQGTEPNGRQRCWQRVMMFSIRQRSYEIEMYAINEVSIFLYMRDLIILPMPRSNQHTQLLPTSNICCNSLPLPAFSNRNRLNSMLAVKVLNTFIPR